MKKMLIIVAVVSLILFLALPVRSEELYRCKQDQEACSDVYSSEVSKPALITIIGITNNELEVDNDTQSDIMRNLLVFIPLIALSVVVVYRRA